MRDDACDVPVSLQAMLDTSTFEIVKKRVRLRCSANRTVLVHISERSGFVRSNSMLTGVKKDSATNLALAFNWMDVSTVPQTPDVCTYEELHL
jgi:hypothetical protein